MPRLALVIIALLCSSLQARAQALRPSAFSMRDIEPVRVFSDTVTTHRSVLGLPPRAPDSTSAPAARRVRVRPILLGTAVGALLGAGLGTLVAAGCDTQHCSSRDEVTTGALAGAGIGALFGLVLGLPPRRHADEP